jgi:hypothetical protein
MQAKSAAYLITYDEARRNFAKDLKKQTFDQDCPDSLPGE